MMNSILKLSLLCGLCIFTSCVFKSDSTGFSDVITQNEIIAVISKDNQDLIAKADEILKLEPVPLTNFFCERSQGGIHDYYSEGDYWWPDKDNPDGPYIRRDGLSNPANFNHHRKALRDLNEWVSTLVAAYEVSEKTAYADRAILHLSVFFLNEETRMNPNLLFAQAIKGRHSGRGIGIIDTIHLIEVAKAIKTLMRYEGLQKDTELGLVSWFEEYTTWMTTHKYGLDEKVHGNNHSTWWAAQVAAFADLTTREDHMQIARSQFKNLISWQMQPDGGFTDELSRTKPYIYMLFHLEGYALLCELASTPADNLWQYVGKNGSVKKAWDYMMPYIDDKSKWPFSPDVANFNEVPIKTTGHLLAARAYDNRYFYEVWQKLSIEKESEEIKRNFPIWQSRLFIK